MVLHDRFGYMTAGLAKRCSPRRISVATHRISGLPVRDFVLMRDRQISSYDRMDMYYNKYRQRKES